MNILIIPDIHNRITKAESILSSKEYDIAILLGDYLDDFGDTALDAQKTARWLKKSLRRENRVHLFGNHDIACLYPDVRELCCTGWTEAKSNAVLKILDEDDIKKFKFLHYEDGWLFTHAGFTNQLWSFLNHHESEVNDELFRWLDNGVSHPLLRAGMGRGGSQIAGGITWCDFNTEFEPVDNVKQVFGHTPLRVPTRCATDGIQSYNTENWCIDTHSNHIGWIRDGEFSFEEV